MGPSPGQAYNAYTCFMTQPRGPDVAEVWIHFLVLVDRHLWGLSSEERAQRDGARRAPHAPDRESKPGRLDKDGSAHVCAPLRDVHVCDPYPCSPGPPKRATNEVALKANLLWRLGAPTLHVSSLHRRRVWLSAPALTGHGEHVSCVAPRCPGRGEHVGMLLVPRLPAASRQPDKGLTTPSSAVSWGVGVDRGERTLSLRVSLLQ